MKLLTMIAVVALAGCASMAPTYQRPDAPVNRSHVPMFAGLHRNLIHVTAHGFVGGVVVINHLAGFLATDAHPL